MDKKTVVIALGGNALGYHYEEQKKAVERTAIVIVDMIAEGHQVIVTHGNGPQVGMIHTAMSDLTLNYRHYTETPLPTCVGMSQGYIGYNLQNAIYSELKKREMNNSVASIVTQVVVDKEDQAFMHPSKPIGRFLTEDEAWMEIEHGNQVMEDAGRGFRRVIASPKPIEIVEIDMIKELVEQGKIVIACGGGGIPVVKGDRNTLTGIPAVIDKDFASALLAKELAADYLVILTAVEKVAINFGKKTQQWLSNLSLEEAHEYIKQGQFAPGSMLPKIEAAMEFASSGKERFALITLLEKAREGIQGLTGTVISQ
ncbi:MAG: carbamate kinase [Eubacteriales bacterium]